MHPTQSVHKHLFSPCHRFQHVMARNQRTQRTIRTLPKFLDFDPASLAGGTLLSSSNAVTNC